jgi:guanyl-specific ribonuclease Sa
MRVFHRPSSALILILSLFLCSSWTALVLRSHAEALGSRTDTVSSAATIDVAAPPQKAHDLLNALQERQGTPLPGYVGGRAFHNRERRLPRGRYREYDVNPRVPGRPRDAERIVIEQRSQKAYYTPDHYRTFIPLN